MSGFCEKCSSALEQRMLFTSSCFICPQCEGYEEEERTAIVAEAEWDTLSSILNTSVLPVRVEGRGKSAEAISEIVEIVAFEPGDVVRGVVRGTSISFGNSFYADLRRLEKYWEWRKL